MDINKEDVLGFIENMTVLELSNFVKELEAKFGVTAAAPMAVMPMARCRSRCRGPGGTDGI